MVVPLGETLDADAVVHLNQLHFLTICHTDVVAVVEIPEWEIILLTTQSF